MNREALEKLIQDVEQQLQSNTERLNHHLSKNERNQILAENQAIENTINKLKNDLKGAKGTEEDGFLLEVEGDPPQQRFTQSPIVKQNKEPETLKEALEQHYDKPS